MTQSDNRSNRDICDGLACLLAVALRVRLPARGLLSLRGACSRSRTTSAKAAQVQRTSLESILCTEELNRRPTRPRDYETENRALVSLAQALAESPRTILQTLADKMLEVFQAGSAGLSLLTKEAGGKRFYWPAVAGMWKSHIGNSALRD